jgi:hypothetical protein
MAQYIPLRDVELTGQELADIERELEARGPMLAHNRAVLREMLRRERRYELWHNQDHSPRDWGEAPRGARA